MGIIFVIEDEENIRDLLRAALERFGYQVEDFEAAEPALCRMEEKKPEAAIFDIMLPGMDGISAIRFIRQNKKLKKLPILILTAKNKELDKVAGLDGGADDYMTKPFSVLELGARLRSLLRRSREETLEQGIKCNELFMNFLTREVIFRDTIVELTYKEYQLLQYLMEHRNRIVPREELIDNVWEYEYTGESRTLDIHIRTLRLKLGEDAARYIRTIRGVGYRFIEIEKRL